MPWGARATRSGWRWGPGPSSRSGYWPCSRSTATLNGYPRALSGITIAPASALTIGAGTEPEREADPYPGLLNGAFLVAAVRVPLTTLALGGVIFLLMPRRSSMARTNTSVGPARYLTGFDEEVKLGQLGEILENDSVVMSIELFDSDRNRIAPPVEPLWRGVTMAVYENGRWHRQRPETSSFPSQPIQRLKSNKIVRQHIRLEATDSTVLFGLRPMLDATAGPRTMPELNANDGTLLRTDPRSETYDYRVVSENRSGRSSAGRDAAAQGRVADPDRHPRSAPGADPDVHGAHRQGHPCRRDHAPRPGDRDLPPRFRPVSILAPRYIVRP